MGLFSRIKRLADRTREWTLPSILAGPTYALPAEIAPGSNEEWNDYVRQVMQTRLGHEISARYESAYTFWGERSLLSASWQDARFDATPGVRMNLAMKARYWEQNSGLVQRLVNLFEQYTVGSTGLRLIPSAGANDDEDAVVDLTPAQEWNERAKAWWQDACNGLEIDSLRCFSETQKMIARNWFVDGEVFILKVRDARGRPRIQVLSSHRVCDPGTRPELAPGNQLIDGVEVDKNGTPVAYWVRQGSQATLQALGTTSYPFVTDTPEMFNRVPAGQVIHIANHVRPGMTRGMTFFYAVLNDLQDMEDLQKMEMMASKSAADLALIYHTKTGEAPTAAGFRRVTQNLQNQDQNGNPVTKQRNLWYDVTMGGRDRYLQIGEDVKALVNERPTVAQQAYWDFLVGKITAGVGISRLLVYPYAPVQGTAVRSDLDTNARFFLSKAATLARAFIQVYEWVMGEAKDWDRTMQGAPADWNRVVVRPPRSVNVDVGKNSSAMLAELEAGVRTRTDIWSEQGEDFKEQTVTLAKEAQFVNAVARKFGVPREQIITPPATVKPPPASAQPPKAPNVTDYVGGVPVNGEVPVNGNGAYPNGHGCVYKSDSRLAL